MLCCVYVGMKAYLLGSMLSMTAVDTWKITVTSSVDMTVTSYSDHTNDDDKGYKQA